MTKPTAFLHDAADVDYPPLGRRVFASCIDGLVVLGGMLLLGTLFGDISLTFAPLRGALFVAFWWGYEPGCTAFGTTLGQRLMGFRVRRVTDLTRRISLPAAWLRYVLKITLGILSFLTMRFNPQGRAIHDLVSGSVVVDVSTLPTSTEFVTD